MLKASALENPFPAGMDMNWALDVQSAQTLDFLAGMHNGKVAWDLGTFTGISVTHGLCRLQSIRRWEGACPEPCAMDLGAPRTFPGRLRCCRST